jgi:ligand-binding sensor domain-containing protein
MLKSMLENKSVAIAMGAAFAIAIIITGVLCWQIRRAQTVLAEVKQQATENQTVRIRIQDFSLAPNLEASLFNSPYAIRDVAAYQENIYAATSSGLVIFDQNGRQLKHWTTLEGLPSHDLTAFAIRNDSLWIGTADAGLLQLSNNQWSHILPAKVEERSVHSLLVTEQGTLLAGTDAGILAYDGQEFHRFLPALMKEKITSIAGSHQRLCIGTFQNGLHVYEAGVLEHYTKQNGLQDSFVTQVQYATDGCYVSTASGVQVLEGKKLRTLAKNLFATSFVVDNSFLWVATRDRGVLPFNTQTQSRRDSATNVARTSALQRHALTFVKKLDSEVLAFSSTEISRLEGTASRREWKIWSRPSTLLTDANVSTLLHRRNGELWVGYFDHGLDIVSAGKDSVSHRNDENLFCINHLSEDAKGRVYVSTANGLVIFDPDGSRMVYRTGEGLLSDRVMQTMPLDAEGKVVAIATTQGFTLKEGDTMKSIYAFHGLVNNHIYTMAADGDQIYLGTLGGISRISKMRVTESWNQMDSGLKRNWVNSMISIQKQLFVGTYGSGMQLRTESGEWRDFPALPEDLEINPNALYYDGRFLFCGTLDRGFYVYDTKHHSWKNVSNELPSLNVTAFAADGNFLYVGTERGLLQIKYDKLSTIPDLI